MSDFVKIDDFEKYNELVKAARKGEEHVVARYAGPCQEYAETGGIHILYGAPCISLDKVDFQGKDYIGLKYGGPCTPPYIIVKYGAPCKKLKA